MPRGFSSWNDRRRPDAKLFSTHSGTPSSSFFGGREHGQPPEELAKYSLEELVAGLMDDDDLMEEMPKDCSPEAGGGHVNGSLLTPFDPVFAPRDPPRFDPFHLSAEASASTHEGSGGGVLVTTSVDAPMSPVPSETPSSLFHPDAEALSRAETTEARPPVMAAPQVAAAPPWQPPGIPGTANLPGVPIPSLDAAAKQSDPAAGPPAPPTLTQPFGWQQCTCLIENDAYGVRIDKAYHSAASHNIELSVVLEQPLLYWEERKQYMWHKKWSLPQITVLATCRGVPLTDVAMGGEVFAVVSSGTLREGHDGLHDQGLSGECQRRLANGSAMFSRLTFQHTSFNCGNRPFRLVITLVAGIPHIPSSLFTSPHALPTVSPFAPPFPPRQPQAAPSMECLACVCSTPIHVDARKRSKCERPDVRQMESNRRLRVMNTRRARTRPPPPPLRPDVIPVRS